MPDYRIIITGCRDWTDEAAVGNFLSKAFDRAGDRTLVVVHGACPTGADKHASDWCRMVEKTHGHVIEEPHPADWSNDGKRAGPARNAEMAKRGANLCGAFWDGIRKRPNGSGSGTFDMIKRATAAGIPVCVIPKDRGDSPIHEVTWDGADVDAGNEIADLTTRRVPVRIVPKARRDA